MNIGTKPPLLPGEDRGEGDLTLTAEISPQNSLSQREGVRAIILVKYFYYPLIPRLRGGRLWPSPGGRREKTFSAAC
jgi:hypothetical protein